MILAWSLSCPSQALSMFQLSTLSMSAPFSCFPVLLAPYPLSVCLRTLIVSLHLFTLFKQQNSFPEPLGYHSFVTYWIQALVYNRYQFSASSSFCLLHYSYWFVLSLPFKLKNAGQYVLKKCQRTSI
jgi:hypothetical protein